MSSPTFQGGVSTAAGSRPSSAVDARRGLFRAAGLAVLRSRTADRPLMRGARLGPGLAGDVVRTSRAPRRHHAACANCAFSTAVAPPAGNRQIAPSRHRHRRRVRRPRPTYYNNGDPATSDDLGADSRAWKTRHNRS
ncbi:hypothetical protein ACRAWF_33280 [Streptomyces sp. L7]